MTHLRAAYHGMNVNVLQQLYNLIMGSTRVSVEWFFGKLKQLSKILGEYRKSMKLQANAVNYHIRAATLLTNAHTYLPLWKQRFSLL